MELADTIATLLRQAPAEPLCNACLAFACSCSLSEVCRITETLVQHAAGFGSSTTSTCSGCRRVTTTFAFLRPTKCAHCSGALGDAALGIVMGGDQFHRACWLRLLTDQRIRLSRSLSRQSRDLIARARAQLDRPRPDHE